MSPVMHRQEVAMIGVALTRKLLEQDEVWVTPKGDMTLVVDLDARARRGVAHWLRDHAVRLLIEEMVEKWLDQDYGEALGLVRQLEEQVEPEVARAWLDAKPLVRALHARSGGIVVFRPGTVQLDQSTGEFTRATSPTTTTDGVS